jgi:hypothetical protein
MIDPDAPVMFARDRAIDLFEDFERALVGAEFSVGDIDDAIGAVAQLFADNAGWPPLDNDQIWNDWILPRVLVRLGIDYDEVYEVTVEPRALVAHGRLAKVA